jgi:KaiC/GvpD/RAD55 family RecA-like ATPase
MAGFKFHASCEECGSSDAKAVYDDGSSHCFSCQHTVPSKEYLEENSKQPKKKSNVKSFTKEPMQTEVKPSGKPPMTRERFEEIKTETTLDIPSGQFRGIRTDISKKFGVRYSFDEDGEMLAQYCPTTKAGELVGLKVRDLPKEFYSEGLTGAECDLFMQFKFNRGGKYVLLVEGEVCALSAYQMLNDYNRSKGSDFETAVVSPTTGANSYKQIAAQYKFLDSFDQIILAFDNDKAGQEAQDKIVQVLPKGKVKLMVLRHKDSNDYLTKGDTRNFVNDFYAAKAYVPDGVLASNTLGDKMREELLIPKIPLPKFMHKLQDMMAGGIPLGRIVNLASASGTGKSTIIDECVYYWIHHSPHKVGVVSLESDAGQYGIKLLSRHIGKKLELLDNQVAFDLLNTEDVLKKEHELFTNEKGEPRFFLMDERDGGLESLKDTIENMIISLGCRVIIADPITDALAGRGNEEQEEFYAWQKGMVKSHKVTFVNVHHVRKSTSGQQANSTGANLHEEDIMGSSSSFKSGACNLIFTRNKEAEDPIERNTTVMKATKIRWTGKTGIAGKYYYDLETHTVHDLDDFANNRFY